MLQCSVSVQIKSCKTVNKPNRRRDATKLSILIAVTSAYLFETREVMNCAVVTDQYQLQSYERSSAGHGESYGRSLHLAV